MTIKFMQENVKVRWDFNAKKYFQILRKIQNLLYTIKISFFALHNSRWNDGTSRCTAKVCVIRPSQAKPSLLALFRCSLCYNSPLLPLPLLSPTHINFTCNVLMFLIRYEIMLITSSGLHVPDKHTLCRDSIVAHRNALASTIYLYLF